VFVGAVVLGVGMSFVFACANRSTTIQNQRAQPASGVSSQLGVETPTQEGPDALELAPLVALTPTGLAFDHEPVDEPGLESKLRTYRANFSVLHPGEPAPREILLACYPTISSERVFAVLAASHLLGFDRAGLVFETMRGLGSTSIGKSPSRITAARVSVGGETAAPGGAQPVRSSDVQNCSQLSERVVALRRAGLPVVLVTRATQ